MSVRQQKHEASSPLGPAANAARAPAAAAAPTPSTHAVTGPSPARNMQAHLAARVAHQSDEDGAAWSPRSALLLASSVSLAGWAAVAMIVRALLH